MNVNEALLDAVSELQVEADKVFPPSPRTAVVSRDDARYSNLRRKINNVCALAATTGKATGEAVAAKWCGDSAILEYGAEVTILSVDHDDPSFRKACWIRWWPTKRDYPVYRSCDITDLDYDETALAPQPAQGAEAVRAFSAIKKAATDYMEAVKSLGQQSGYNGLTFFEAPISKMPNDELGMEAVRRWQALNDTGKALTAVLAALDKPSPGMVEHPDDAAVDRFADAMKAKLAKKRAEGRGGWETTQCTAQILSDLLRNHVAKGDPVDVGNLAMMLHQRNERIV